MFKVGDRLRRIRSPYFGELCTVTHTDFPNGYKPTIRVSWDNKSIRDDLYWTENFELANEEPPRRILHYRLSMDLHKHV